MPGFSTLANNTNAKVAAIGSSSVSARSGRRLTEKILLAFHHACDDGEYDVAEQLLQILEATLTRRNTLMDSTRRKSLESLVAAHERLWYLRHPEETTPV